MAQAPAATDPTLAERADALYTTAIDPLFWIGIAMTAVRVLIIVLLILGALALVRRALERWRAGVADLPPLHPRKQRVLTVSNLFQSVARYVIWAIGVIMVLAELGHEIGPLLAGAGIAGLAIGFGAQTLVRDVISGLFLLFDDIIHVGDVISFSGHVGVVESISLRLIRVRKFDGELVTIPAGELRTFGNRSVGFQRAIVPVSIAYEQDTETVLRALERIADEWAARDENRAVMLDDAPQVQGILELGDSAVTARIVVQVIPGEQFRCERELRQLIKQRFDEWGLEIPFARQTVYLRQEPEPPARKVTLPPLPKSGLGESEPLGSD